MEILKNHLKILYFKTVDRLGDEYVACGVNRKNLYNTKITTDIISQFKIAFVQCSLSRPTRCARLSGTSRTRARTGAHGSARSDTLASTEEQKQNTVIPQL